jgi:rod shape-determining protein MreD
MSSIDPVSPRYRVRAVPLLSTMAGSAVTLLPIVATWPMLPPCGLLMLLGWRLLRPELWPAWVALPLGLFDDILNGQPLGSAAALWTIAFLVLDAVDRRLIWRDYWIDWGIAAMAITACIAAGWLIAAFIGSSGSIVVVVPQILISIGAFPLAARVCAVLDHWRLRR